MPNTDSAMNDSVVHIGTDPWADLTWTELFWESWDILKHAVYFLAKDHSSGFGP